MMYPLGKVVQVPDKRPKGRRGLFNGVIGGVVTYGHDIIEYYVYSQEEELLGIGVSEGRQITFFCGVINEVVDPHDEPVVHQNRIFKLQWEIQARYNSWGDTRAIRGSGYATYIGLHPVAKNQHERLYCRSFSEDGGASFHVIRGVLIKHWP